MATKFVFLVLPELHILDLAGPDQAIHEAIDYGAPYETSYCGIGEKVVTTSGLAFGAVPHYSKISLQPGDFLMIPGSSYAYLTSDSFLKNKSLFSWLLKQYDKDVNICSICMGAFVLAESGLLNSRQCTTHFKKTKELQKRYPKIQVIENVLFTEEDRIYTSAGIAAGIDLTLHLIEKLNGAFFAHQVARELVVYNRRKGNDAQESVLLQFRNHIHAGIHKVQDYLIHHLSQKASLGDLAEMANMSERNFTRVFRKETGLSVNEFITQLRIAKAIALLQNPDTSVIKVAQDIGLKSDKQLRRILKSKQI